MLRASAYHLADSLRGGTAGNPVGGSFGPAGWTVTDRHDLIWFAIPTTPSSGSIEFAVSNITNASLFDGDNDVFTMYEAAGLTEPIRYSPDFRADNYKAWVRLRTEPGMHGLQKTTVALCPDSASSYGDTCACGPFFVDEVTGGDSTWDGTPQPLRVEWGGGHVRCLRNGVVVNDIDYSATGCGWGPREMHFSIGSSRPGGVPYSGMPLGAVFSDLVVDTVDHWHPHDASAWETGFWAAGHRGVLRVTLGLAVELPPAPGPFSVVANEVDLETPAGVPFAILYCTEVDVLRTDATTGRIESCARIRAWQVAAWCSRVSCASHRGTPDGATAHRACRGR